MVAIPEKAQDYRSDVDPIWCPGCGDFGVLKAVSEALVQHRVPPHRVVIVSGIGCSGRFPAFLKCYGFHGVHGRVLPTATGIAIANPELTVIGVGGDGDGLSIGAGHLPHAARRNADLTYLLLDNEVYGLTKGQASPTSLVGLRTRSSPYGTYEAPLNPIAMAIVYNASFVGRGFSGRPKELAQLITEAIGHPGFAFIQVISPCVTFNNIYKSIAPRVKPIPPDHPLDDRMRALELAYDEETIWIGVFYHVSRPSLNENLNRMRALAQKAGPPSFEEVLERYV
jgi:2-oxoglutarate ferredoxin oxidoreductase subunit beta